MRKCRITVLDKKYFPELVKEYCKDPSVGVCHKFEVGQEIVIDKESYFNMNITEGFCSEAWHCLSHYVYSALQGGAIMEGWMKDRDTMITCCNDGVRPVIFKLESIEE